MPTIDLSNPPPPAATCSTRCRDGWPSPWPSCTSWPRPPAALRCRSPRRPLPPRARAGWTVASARAAARRRTRRTPRRCRPCTTPRPRWAVVACWRAARSTPAFSEPSACSPRLPSPSTSTSRSARCAARPGTARPGTPSPPGDGRRHRLRAGVVPGLPVGHGAGPGGRGAGGPRAEHLAGAGGARRPLRAGRRRGRGGALGAQRPAAGAGRAAHRPHPLDERDGADERWAGRQTTLDDAATVARARRPDHRGTGPPAGLGRRRLRREHQRRRRRLLGAARRRLARAAPAPRRRRAPGGRAPRRASDLAAELAPVLAEVTR